MERQRRVASRPELSSTEQPLRGRKYCTARKVKSQELLGSWLGEGGRSSPRGRRGRRVSVMACVLLCRAVLWCAVLSFPVPR